MLQEAVGVSEVYISKLATYARRPAGLMLTSYEIGKASGGEKQGNDVSLAPKPIAINYTGLCRGHLTGRSSGQLAMLPAVACIILRTPAPIWK